MVFRSYPQLIRKLFNAYRFGPPSSVTWTSAWPRVDHLVSRLCKRHAITEPKSALTACRRTVSGTVSLPCYGCFSPFPHGTCPLSVSGECLALADGPAGFTSRLQSASRTGLSPSAGRLSRRFRSPSSCHILVLQPRRNRNPGGLGSSPVARHYWGNHVLFSLPLGTKMFQFPRFASTIKVDDSPSDCRVAPFGNLRIKGRLRLPGAFRSLPRPSSPSRATGIRRAPFPAFACPATRMMRGAYLGIALFLE